MCCGEASAVLVVYGDVFSDAKANARDVIALMKYIVGWRDSALSDEIADFNRDSRVNARDVIALMKAIVSGN